MANDEWRTPAELVPRDIDLDVCSTHQNAVALRHFTVADDGLEMPWHSGHAWCNPPYSRGQIRRWLAKGMLEVASGRCQRVTFLLPADTSTSWWHELVIGGRAGVKFIRGRVHFSQPDGKTGPARFASALVTYGG